MAAERFPIEAGHVMMFARAIGDPNPVYYDPDEAIAPPTFVQAAAQFDPDYGLRPKTSGLQRPAASEGSGEASGSGGGSGERRGGGGGGTGLHAEQHYEYHRPLRVGDVLTATTAPGKRWEKEGRRAGKLVFAESVTEYRNQDGELVVTARNVAVRTERAVEQ